MHIQNSSRFKISIFRPIAVIFLIVFLSLTGRSVLAAEQTKVGLLLFGAITGDGGWNSQAYAGLKQAEKDHGIKVTLVEKVNPPDFEAVFRDMASQGYGLLFGHSFGFGDPAVIVAKDYPDVNFVITTGAVAADNVLSLNLLDQEGNYLNGVLAALMSKSGTIGIIGGFDYPSINKLINGAIDGAKSVNPDINILISYAGSWDDPAKGLELANAMIENGADVLFDRAAGTGIGVMKAAETAGVWGVGNVIPCSESFPTICLTATEYLHANLMQKIVDLHENGELTGGFFNWGIAAGAIDATDYHSNVPKEHVDFVNNIRQQIIDGDLKVEESWVLKDY